MKLTDEENKQLDKFLNENLRPVTDTQVLTPAFAAMTMSGAKIFHKLKIKGFEDKELYTIINL